MACSLANACMYINNNQINIKYNYNDIIVLVSHVVHVTTAYNAAERTLAKVKHKSHNDM